MRRVRYYFCALIFILLTAVKLLVPGAAAVIQERAGQYVSADADISQAVDYVRAARAWLLGGTETDSVEVYAPPRETAGAYSPRLLDRVTLCISYPSAPEEYDAVAADAPAPAEELGVEPLPEAVQTFLDSQSQYADLALPANVSYDYGSLPFEYAVPVSGVQSSGFGYRLHPIKNEVRFHYGTDFAANSGTEICAFADGIVAAAGESDSYGKYVILEHQDGWRTLYAHCSALYADAGQSISMGDTIALVGATGLATGPHLHLELMHNGVYVNPEYYVNASV